MGYFVLNNYQPFTVQISYDSMLEIFEESRKEKNENSSLKFS